ncbi:MAG: 2-octaprenyl-6-methoxyphenyl hydroxylase [Legionellales bacterium]|nr:2-octaprenyl-6-methoxyphenyl hydroxylase [Legionellales bacterium]
MQTDFNIIINGGGLAGNSLALALAHTSLTVGIVEPFPPANKQRSLLESRTIALSHGAKRIYEGMNIWSDFEPYCTPIQSIHVSDKGRFGMTRIHAKEQNMPALGYVMQIAEVNRILCEKLSTYANIHYVSPARILHAALVDERWQLSISQNEQTYDYCTDLLIAADGGDSPLRKIAGLSVDEKDYQQTAIVTSIQLTHSHNYTAYERFFDGGAIALLPVKDETMAVVVTVNNQLLSFWQGLSDGDFLAKLQHVFGYRLGRFAQVGSRTLYPLKLVTSPEQTAKQFVLMGNAAHILHPIAAQSFNLSLRDIAVLAEMLVNALNSGQSITEPSLLADYTDLRHRDQRRTIQFTDGLIEVFSSPFLALPRNIAMTGLDMIPPLKTMLGKYGAGTLGRLSRLARGLGI